MILLLKMLEGAASHDFYIFFCLSLFFLFFLCYIIFIINTQPFELFLGDGFSDILVQLYVDPHILVPIALISLIAFGAFFLKVQPWRLNKYVRVDVLNKYVWSHEGIVMSPLVGTKIGFNISCIFSFVFSFVK